MREKISAPILEAFLEAIRVDVGAKRANWNWHHPYGTSMDIECFWSWGDRGFSILCSDEAFCRPPPLRSTLDLIDRRMKE